MFTVAAAAVRNKADLNAQQSGGGPKFKKPGEGLEETNVKINPVYGYQKKVRHPRKYISAKDRASSSSTISMQDDTTKYYIARYYKYTINPNATYKICWDGIITLVVIYSVIMVPLQLSFSVATDGAFSVIDWIVDVIFMIDILVNFFTAYNDSRGTVYNNCMIVKHYLRTWFLIDTVSTIPFDKIFSSASSALKLIRLLKIIRLLKLLKLFRLLKLVRYIEVIKESFPGNETLFTIISFSITLTMAGHLMACLWYATVSIQSNDLDWIDLTDNIDKDDIGKKYVASLYWAFTTMTTVGFGDIVAESISEKIVASISMVIGAAVLGYVMGNISMLLQDYNIVDGSKRKKMERLKNYCLDRNIPINLRKRLEAHQKYSHNNKSVINEDDLLNKFPSRDHIGLVYKEYGELIEDVRILKEFYNYTAVCQFVHLLYPFYAIKGEFIMLRGEIAYQIYVLRNGLLYYGLPVGGKIDTNKSNIVTTIMGEVPKHEFFGKDALNANESIYSYNVLCEGRSELLFARSADILPLINTYPYYKENMFVNEVEVMNRISNASEFMSKQTISPRRLIRPKESSRLKSHHHTMEYKTLSTGYKQTPLSLIDPNTRQNKRRSTINLPNTYLDSPISSGYNTAVQSPLNTIRENNNNNSNSNKQIESNGDSVKTVSTNNTANIEMTEVKTDEVKIEIDKNENTNNNNNNANPTPNTTPTNNNNNNNDPNAVYESENMIMDTTAANTLLNSRIGNLPLGMNNYQQQVQQPEPVIPILKTVRGSTISEDRASTTSTRTSVISQESSFKAFKKHHYVIYPYHPFKIAWDMYIAVLILYSVVEVPLVIAFEINLPSLLHGLDLYLITVSFVIDILLSFNTGMINSFDAPNYNRKDICISYIKFWFWIDLVSTIPFDELFSSTSGLKATKLIKIIRLIRLVRLIRLLKLDKIMQKYDDSFTVNPVVIQLVKQLFVMLFTAHLVGCLWYGVSAYSISADDPNNNWITDYCVYQNETECLPLKNETLGIKYLTSIYFSFALMGTVGYGDIHANHSNITEMLVSCVLLVIGTTAMSYLVSSVMSSVQSVNPGKAIRSDKLRLINGYSDDIGLSDDMTKRLRQISDYTLTIQSGFDIDNIFSNFPNMLKREVLEISTDPIISCFGILNELEQAFPGFVAYIWPLFRCYQARANDYLWRTGEDINELYFILHGELKLKKMNGQSTIIKIGSILGEASMLVPLSVYCINCSDCQAVITSQILSLQRNQFEYIKGISHEVYNQMKQKLLNNIEVEQPIYIDPVNIDDEIRDMCLCIESYCPPRSTHEFLTDVNITNITEGNDEK